jgi:hypothetical protein
MSKKITMICAALAAFMAFAVLPAVASASPEVTFPTGTRLAVPAKIHAHNVGNTKMTTSSGNIECTTATMTGTLTVNNGSQIEGDVETASFTGGGSGSNCTGPLGDVQVTVTSLPWCVRSTAGANEFEVRGGNCNETSRALTFTLDTGGLTCAYSKANVTGTFATHPEDAKLTVSEQNFTKSSGSFLCPGSGKLDMTFTLENDGANPESETLYIS